MLLKNCYIENSEETVDILIEDEMISHIDKNIVSK